MKLITIICLIATFLVYSHDFKNDECINPGELLSRNFSHLSGDKVSAKSIRQGSLQAKRTFELKANLKTNLYKFYNEDFCQKVSFIKKVKVCTPVDYEVALGRGNKTFKQLFNLRLSLSKRAGSLKDAISFATNLSDAERLEISLSIITQLIDWSISNSIPKNQKEYELAISSLPDLDQKIANELLSSSSKNTFGFIPPEGVIITEKTGNQYFQDLFNFSIPLYERADSAKEMFSVFSLTDNGWAELVKSFSVFANENGLPQSWGELLLMLKKSESLGVLQVDDHKKIIFLNEISNRSILGFEAAANLCKLVEKTFYVNQIKTRQTKDLEKIVSKKIILKGSNAPLLINEKESFIISFDGQNVEIESRDRFNKYSSIINELDPNTTQILLKGERVRKTPKNTIKAKLSIVDNKYNLNLKDTYQYFDLVKKTTVRVTLYKSVPLWFDKKIKTFSITLSSRDISFNTQINKLLKNKKAYVKFEISRDGEFFNDRFSNEIESEEI